MTEHDWLTSVDPTAMLTFLRGRASDRKLRLFAAGCCRRHWHLAPDPRSRWAVEVGERFADGLATDEERREAFAAAGDAPCDPTPALSWHAPLATDDERKRFADWCARETAGYAFRQAAAPAVPLAGLLRRLNEAVAYGAFNAAAAGDGPKVHQAALLRCVFGSLFRPVTPDLSWLTSTVVGLASAIYDNRAFHDLPILADALMDAGCSDEAVLAHCRGEGPHTRGCWAVDMCLGKQ